MSFVKVQAQQTISSNQNLMDFVIPASFGGVDMDRSYLQLLSTIVTTDAGGLNGVHNFNASFAVGSNRAALSNSCLIRNTRLSTSKKGQLENVRRADLLNQTIQHYSRNTADNQGCQFKDLTQTSDPHTQVQSIYRNLNGSGTTISTNVEAPVRIEMRDMFGLGRSKLNLNSLGDIHIHLEGNFNTASGVVEITETPNGVKAGNIAALTGEIITALNPYPNYWIVPAFPQVNGSAQSSILIPLTFTDANAANLFVVQSNSPYWVGQKIGFTTPDPGDQGKMATPRTITRIDFVQSVSDSDSNVARGWQIRLTFNGDWLTTGNLSGEVPIFLIPIKAESATWSLVRAELVLCLIDKPPNSSGIQYKTYNTIEDFAAPTTSFQRQYQLPPNAIANLVCFDSNPSDHNSYDSTIKSYTLRSDNVDLVNRPITISASHTTGRPRDPLHAIMLEKTLARMGVPFKNYTEVFPTAMTLPTTLIEGTSGTAFDLQLGPLAGGQLADGSTALTGITANTYPGVEVSDGSGTGATVTVITTGGETYDEITGLYFDAVGSGYKVGDVLKIKGDSILGGGAGFFTITLRDYNFTTHGLPKVEATLPSVGGNEVSNNGQGVLVLPAPLPLTSIPKLFQINIEKDTGSMNLVMFQQLIRQVKF